MALLDPALMQRLRALGLGSKKRASGVQDGGRRSERRGRSQEFADHRPYVPGDDLRFLDWHLYGRLDSLWIKLFEEEQDRTVQLLVDCSASMEGEKLAYARKAAAALAFVALGSNDRVAVAGLADTTRHYAPARRGRNSAPGLFKSLEQIEAGGGSDLAAALDGYPRQRGGGIGLVFTDFLWPQGVEGAVKRLAARVSELWVIHVLSPVDVRPSLEGDVTLVDRETGEEVQLSVDENILDRYHETVRAWAGNVEDICRRYGVGYSRVLTTAPLDEWLMRDLRRLGLIQ